jgi:mycothiol synthase
LTVLLRPLRTSDIPQLVALMAAAEEVDDRGEHYSAEDLEEELANPDLDLEKDTVAAVDGDQLVGYASFLTRADPVERRAFAFGVTHPDRRGEGIGSRLAEAMMSRARELQRAESSPLLVLSHCNVDDAAQAELLQSLGMVPDGWSFNMRVALDGVAPAPDFPDGYAVRAVDADDGDRVRLAHNRAFDGNPGFSPWSPTEWEQWVTGSRSFRPELSFVVTPEGNRDTVAAYVQSYVYDAHHEATGQRDVYVSRIGTVPEHRRHGLATTLLQHCLVVFQHAGFDEASLDVDSRNPTGALGIYERAGFRTRRRSAHYSIELGP